MGGLKLIFNSVNTECWGVVAGIPNNGTRYRVQTNRLSSSDTLRRIVRMKPTLVVSSPTIPVIFLISPERQFTWSTRLVLRINPELYFHGRR